MTHSSGPENLNIATSGNAGQNAEPKMVWREGFFHGQEIIAPNPAHAHKAEKFKAVIRVKVVHSFRVIKRQFDDMKTWYRGLKKNAAQIATLFALSNLWMARHDLMGARA